jgi:hypothetical protein
MRNRFSPAPRSIEAFRMPRGAAEPPDRAFARQPAGTNLDPSPLSYTISIGLLAFSVATILLLAPVLARLLGLAASLLPG